MKQIDFSSHTQVGDKVLISIVHSGVAISGIVDSPEVLLKSKTGHKSGIVIGCRISREEDIASA
jgi:hypothetical protein